MPTARLMAPWWRDYSTAIDPSSTSGKNVGSREVKKLIAPHAEILRNDEVYRETIAKLLDNERGEPRATRYGKKPLEDLLAATGPKYTFQASIVGTPRYSPGMGIVPMDPPPDMVFGPHVHMTVQLGEATAKVVARAELDDRPSYITVNGRRQHVQGTLNVYVHGEGDRLTEGAAVPKEIDVPAPLLASVFGRGPKYALVVRDDREGANNRILSKSTFETGPMPM